MTTPDAVSGPGEASDHMAALPAGYDDEAASADRRALSTLGAKDVTRRVKRRLRARVGDEAAIAARLVAFERQRHVPSHPRQVLAAAHAEAVALADEYVAACAYVWGADHPDVLANADAIARGDVLPWEARHVIMVERDRAEEFRRRSAAIGAAADRRRRVSVEA